MNHYDRKFKSEKERGFWERCFVALLKTQNWPMKDISEVADKSLAEWRERNKDR